MASKMSSRIVLTKAASDAGEAVWQRRLTRLDGSDSGRWHPWIAGWRQSRGNAGRGDAVGNRRHAKGIDGGVLLLIGLHVPISSGTGHLTQFARRGLLAPDSTTEKSVTFGIRSSF